jgi:hypothetical protein
MNTPQLLVASSLALVASISTSHAGPCSSEIDRAMAEIDTKLKAVAAAGPTAKQSSAATMHRQPTPKSVGAAETGVGDVSAAQVEAVKAAIARAREADGAGDQNACEQALADARQALGK